MSEGKAAPDKVNLAAAFARFDETWSPRIAGSVNETQVKLAKLEGEFVWHRHEAEDELFLVTKGRLVMRFRDRDVTLEPGEFIIVPAGTEHCPVAADGVCEVMLVEPATTLNTGDVESERTVRELKTID
jgi:mannose-6-phosphate isomerase-like protein (cupin superfamily)